MKTFVILVCFVAAVTAVRFGPKVSKDDFKANYQFVVAILICPKGGGSCDVCTGSLIKPGYVLSAAHCFCDENKFVKVYADNLRAQSGTVIGNHATVVKHSSYDCGSQSKSQYDVALVRLTTRTTEIAPVPLRCDKDTPAGSDVTIIGYGKDAVGLSGILRASTIKTKGCAGEILCAPIGHQKSRTPSIASGDFGGPLLAKNGATYEQVAVQVGRSFAGQIFAPLKPLCSWINEY